MINGIGVPEGHPIKPDGTLALRDAMGHRTAEVCERLRAELRVKPTEGEARMAQPYAVANIDFYPGTARPIPGGLKLWRVNTNYFKDRLHAKLSIASGDPGAFHLYSEATEEYASHMVAEYRDEAKGEWIVKSGRTNHYWDCEVLAMVAAEMLGIKHWIPEAEQAVESASPAENPYTKGRLTLSGRM